MGRGWGAWLVVVAAGGAVVSWAAHARRAELADAARLVTELEPLRPLVPGDGRVHRVEINGLVVEVARATRAGSADAAIDDAVTTCAQDAPSVDRLDAVAAVAGDATARRSLHLARVRRQRGEGIAAVVCAYADASNDEASAPMRYAVAQELGDGTSAVTALTTSRAMPFASLFPERDDAPGDDPPGGLRPRAARRMLTARVDGGEAVNVYGTAAPLAAARDAYTREREADGWSSSAAVAAASDEARVYVRGGRAVLASFLARDATTDPDVRTLVTLAAAP